MKVSELITHLQKLPQDAEVHIVIDVDTGGDEPIKDIEYNSMHHQVIFDNWPADGKNGTETLMSYEIAAKKGQEL